MQPEDDSVLTLTCIMASSARQLLRAMTAKTFSSLVSGCERKSSRIRAIFIQRSAERTWSTRKLQHRQQNKSNNVIKKVNSHTNKAQGLTSEGPNVHAY